MRQQFRHQAWIVLATAAIFFTNLGATGLWDKDETLYASCAREMYQAGDWVVPVFNGEMFPDKPPLMYWLMISGYKWFGVNELAARFWSAVLGVGTALVTYHLGRLLFRERVGFWAGLIVGSSVIYTVSARAATVDSALTFATTLAMLAFVVGAVRRRRCETETATTDDGRPGVFLPSAWLPFALMYAAMGVAVLAKGPVGVILPVGTVGLFLLLTTGKALDRQREASSSQGITARCCRLLFGFVRLLTPRNLWRTTWQMRPLTALAMIGVVAVPWFVLVGTATDGAWLEKFFGEQNFGRAMQSMQGHGGSVFYYILAILIGFFPWSVFLGPSLAELGRRIRQHHVWRTQYVFVACWLGVYVAFWSLVSTKLPHYVLPAYPALALLTAAFVEGWLADPARVRRFWGRNAAITLIVVGVGILIAVPIITSIYLPGEWLIGLVGLVLVAGGACCLYYILRDLPARAMTVFATTAVIFLTSTFGFAALGVARHQNAPALLAQIRQSSPGPPDLVAYGYFKESYVFYAGRPVPHIGKPAELRKFLAAAQHPYVITCDGQEARIEQDFPGEFQVFARRPRLLRSGEAVVLTRRADRDVLHTAADPNSDRMR